MARPDGRHGLRREDELDAEVRRLDDDRRADVGEHGGARRPPSVLNEQDEAPEQLSRVGEQGDGVHAAPECDLGGQPRTLRDQHRQGHLVEPLGCDLQGGFGIGHCRAAILVTWRCRSSRALQPWNGLSFPSRYIIIP